MGTGTDRNKVNVVLVGKWGAKTKQENGEGQREGRGESNQRAARGERVKTKERSKKRKEGETHLHQYLI